MVSTANNSTKQLNISKNLKFLKEDEVKEISDEEDWQFVTIGDQVNSHLNNFSPKII